jgi:hypothetical protein
MPAAAIPPQHSFAQHRGYVAVGADLLNGSMTIGAAQELCNSLSDCLAITMVRAAAREATAAALHPFEPIPLPADRAWLGRTAC